MNLKVGSFFSGIGGFELGFEKAGFKTVFQCEIDQFCQRVLGDKWPKVKRFTDIREIDEKELPTADVWTGGFPCQDLSLARMGKREGLGGSKSGLFFQFANLIKQRTPRVILIENVPGLLSSHEGRDFGIVLSTLAEIGYSVGWRVLNSKFFGVPQSRQRLYLVGCYRDGQGPSKILFDAERRGGDPAKNKKNGTKPIPTFKDVIGKTGKEKPVYQAIAYCLYATSARHTGTDWSRTYVSYPDKGMVRRLIPKECEGIMGFPTGWTDVGRPDENEEVIDSHRYHALGNAVTPPVIYSLAANIKDYLENYI
ncbi:MAG: DNA (cytosine-5-)-methyltransferase [Fibrobacteria bacterium]